MTREMAERMDGEDAARILAEACLEEFDRWSPEAIQQGSSIANRGDTNEAAKQAVYYLRSDLHDYLALKLATELTALRLQGAL